LEFLSTLELLTATKMAVQTQEVSLHSYNEESKTLAYIQNCEECKLELAGHT